MGVGETTQAVCLTLVTLAIAKVVACIAYSTIGIVSVAVVAVCRGADYASGGEAAIRGSTLLACLNTSLADVAMEVLASDALVVDELISVLAR